tara:strand:- start:3271 stop:4257 length:987 start_codon:yes stop_codon:yes gene_type:complete
MKQIAIIGGGLSGLVAAGILQETAQVTVFEKSPGCGGRVATRFADPFIFDHGAQFFKARSNDFQMFLDPLIKQGVIHRWDANFSEIKNGVVSKKTIWSNHEPHYVGYPNMNSLGLYLSESLTCISKTHIKSIDQNRFYKWTLTDTAGSRYDNFDWVIVSTPAKQSAELLPSHCQFYHQLPQECMKGCFTIMLGFTDSLNLAYDAALIHDPMLSWISLNHTKPGRLTSPALVIHSTNDWAEFHLNNDITQVHSQLTHHIHDLLSINTQTAVCNIIHRWRYANCQKHDSETQFIDHNLKLAACGDWCIQGRVEAAFLSGLKTANAIKQSL